MDASKELIPVSSLIRESWQKYIKQFSELIWIPIIPSLILAIADYLNVFSDPFLKGIGDLMTVVGVLFSILSTLALIYAAHNGKQFNESYRYAEENFLKYIWVMILSFVIVVGGMFLFVVPALIFIVWFSIAGYVFVVEGSRGLGAILKSKEYFRGYFWPLVLRLAVAALIAFAVALLAGLLGYAGGQSGIIAFSFIFQILLTPFLVVYELSIYNNLRRLRPEIVNTEVQNNRMRFTLTAIWGVSASVLLGVVLILAYGISAVIQAIMK
jgi:hypothetical protein